MKIPVVGRRQNEVYNLLHGSLPPAVLLCGVEGVGKWTIAQRLAWEYTEPQSEFDTQVVLPGQLIISAVREIIDFCQTAPLGNLKVVLAGLDGANRQAQNALLKVLEEPPHRVHFILVASDPPLPTISSRCQQFFIGPLRNEEVQQVLESQGVEPSKARTAALMGRGRVGLALSLAETAGKARERAIAALRAAAARDEAGLTRAMREWGLNEHEMLGVWAREASMPHWRLFSPSDVPNVPPPAAQQVMYRLGEFELARPKLAARTVLDWLFWR